MFADTAKHTRDTRQSATEPFALVTIFVISSFIATADTSGNPASFHLFILFQQHCESFSTLCVCCRSLWLSALSQRWHMSLRRPGRLSLHLPTRLWRRPTLRSVNAPCDTYSGMTERSGFPRSGKAWKSHEFSNSIFLIFSRPGKLCWKSLRLRLNSQSAARFFAD